jgi:hypothetical protein
MCDLENIKNDPLKITLKLKLRGERFSDCFPFFRFHHFIEEKRQKNLATKKDPLLLLLLKNRIIEFADYFTGNKCHQDGLISKTANQNDAWLLRHNCLKKCLNRSSK